MRKNALCRLLFVLILPYIHSPPIASIQLKRYKSNTFAELIALRFQQSKPLFPAFREMLPKAHPRSINYGLTCGYCYPYRKMYAGLLCCNMAALVVIIKPTPFDHDGQYLGRDGNRPRGSPRLQSSKRTGVHSPMTGPVADLLLEAVINL